MSYIPSAEESRTIAHKANEQAVTKRQAQLRNDILMGIDLAAKAGLYHASFDFVVDSVFKVALEKSGYKVVVDRVPTRTSITWV